MLLWLIAERVVSKKNSSSEALRFVIVIVSQLIFDYQDAKLQKIFVTLHCET